MYKLAQTTATELREACVGTRLIIETQTDVYYNEFREIPIYTNPRAMNLYHL